MESYDEENMFKIKSSDIPKQFVPTEEIPDRNPDPSEALMLKEDPAQEDEDARRAVERGDPNDLGRLPSYLGADFPEDDHYEQPPTPELSKENDELVDRVEEGHLKEDSKPINEFDVNEHESHGPRGRKPEPGYTIKVIRP